MEATRCVLQVHVSAGPLGEAPLSPHGLLRGGGPKKWLFVPGCQQRGFRLGLSDAHVNLNPKHTFHE